MEQTKRIGVLTSGGDCPGLNAIIRSVVKCATRRGWEVYGIPYGTEGFINLDRGEWQPNDLRLQDHGYDIPGILHGLDILQFLSGSILGSLSRGNPRDPEVAAHILQGYRNLNLDALIAVGGDGSLEIINELADKGGWDWVAIPKTIDNDVPFTERSVGFDTAVDTVTKAIYDLTFTAASHERIMVVQVMGRDAGHLALHAGIAGGADAIFIPELVPQLCDRTARGLCDRIADLREEGRKFGLIVISEGVKTTTGEKDKYIGDYLARQIKECSQKLCQTEDGKFCSLQDVDTRATVLGHIQRSGIPSSFDRLLATAFGKKAVDLIAEESYRHLVVWRNGEVCSKPLSEAIPRLQECHAADKCPGPVDPENNFMVKTARSLGVYLGE